MNGTESLVKGFNYFRIFVGSNVVGKLTEIVNSVYIIYFQLRQMYLVATL